jgi:hypothetical protein
VQQHQAEPDQLSDTSQESFLGSFGRVPSGLDPTQVYSYFLKMSARLRQLEEQARRVSAPFLLEAALREAADVRTQSAQAAERAYNDIVRTAHQEAGRLRNEAEQQAARMLEEARASLADAQRRADELLQQARRDDARIRREAGEWTTNAELELERLSVDYAGFLQRLLERRQAGGSAPGEGAVTVPTPEAAAAAPTSERTAARPSPNQTTSQPPEHPSPAPPPSAIVEPTQRATPAEPPREEASAREAEAAQRAQPPSPQPGPVAGSTNGRRDREPDLDHPAHPEKSADQDKGGFRLPSWLDS